MKPTMTSQMPVRIEGELPSFGQGGEWINTKPLTPSDLRGHVVLVEFWTYSCINWLRTLPYVRAWEEKYRNDGLIVIGVHSPEFPFEHDLENVRRAVKLMGIKYPVVLDSEFKIWRSFGNEAWPALYFVDAQGRIRHHYYGEGNYDVAEEVLQQLLSEAGRTDTSMTLVAVEPAGVEAAADWRNLRTPESYVGYARSENFASPEREARDARRTYSVPAKLDLNSWALAGDWTIGEQTTVLHTKGGRIAFRFHARDVHLVMGAATAGGSVRYRVLLDGKPPAGAHGLDVDSDGQGTAREPRLYQLIRQAGPITDCTFEIEFLDEGVAAFVFTFG